MDQFKSLFFIVLLTLALFQGLSFAASSEALDQQFGSIKTPRSLKPWEVDPEKKKVLPHPKNFGILDFNDPSTTIH